MQQKGVIILIGFFLLIVTGGIIYQFDRQKSESGKIREDTKILFSSESPQKQDDTQGDQNTGEQAASLKNQMNNTPPMDTQKKPEPLANQDKQPEKKTETSQKKYTATLHTTKGDIVIAFNDKATPRTVENFITLSKKNFYDGTIFHRVISGFMIQGGDPFCNPGKDASLCGTGGPGYAFPDEPFEGEYTRGTVAMANSGPNTNGSQFFIMHADYALPKNYVIFAHVIKGMEVVDAIATDKMTRGNDGAMSKPLEPTHIKSVEVKEEVTSN